MQQLSSNVQHTQSERERQAGGRCGICNAFAARITKCSKLLSYLFNEIAFLSFQFSIPFDSIRFACCPSLASFFSLFFSCCWCSYSAWIAHLHLDWGVMQSNDQKEYYMYGVSTCVYLRLYWCVLVCVCVCIGVRLFVYWCVFGCVLAQPELTHFLQVFFSLPHLAYFKFALCWPLSLSPSLPLSLYLSLSFHTMLIIAPFLKCAQ